MNQQLPLAMLTALAVGGCAFSFSTNRAQEPESSTEEPGQTEEAQQPEETSATTVASADDSTTQATTDSDDTAQASEEPTVALPTVQGDAIVLQQPIQFDPGTATLMANAGNEQTLAPLIAFLQKYEKVTQLRIEGHTDNVGEVAANLGLSGQRALSVKQYLVEQGIDESRLLAVGFGDAKPIVPNDTAETRAQNQRTEFRIAGIGGKPRLGLDPLAGGTPF